MTRWDEQIGHYEYWYGKLQDTEKADDEIGHGKYKVILELIRERWNRYYLKKTSGQWDLPSGDKRMLRKILKEYGQLTILQDEDSRDWFNNETAKNKKRNNKE